MRRTFIRTPQACETCRRRKIKCDGIRPRCRRCATRNASCVWSRPDPGYNPDVASEAPVSPAAVSSLEQAKKGIHTCLDVFFERHFANDFCSFDHWPDFEQKCQKDAFLSSAVVALCGRYLKPQDAQSYFGLDSGRQVSKVYLHRTRALAKESSDDPTVSHIQGNLVLAMAELLHGSGSRHWLFAGMAIRMAEAMRLNKDFHQKHSLKGQEVRRRTFWACLMFDRVLAYFLAKHRTIDIENISIPLPGTDMSLAYQEETKGVTLSDIATRQRPSELGLGPYLIKTVCLWSDLADFATYSRRRLDRFPPTDPHSMFSIRHEALCTWVGSLHPSLRWNFENYQTQRQLGKGSSFVAMHLLLLSGSCAAHQCYLPHFTLFTKPDDLVDAAGWSYLHREPLLIDTCVSNAIKFGEVLTYLVEGGSIDNELSLQAVWVAPSVLIVANVFLWLQYTQDNVYSDDSLRQKSQSYFQTVHTLVSSWTPHWKAAERWKLSLNAMQDLYKAAYVGDINETILSPAATISIHSDDESAPDFRPQPGDGYPSLISLPNLPASVKFVTSDTSARFIDMQSIWLQLSGGWPYGATGAAYLMEPAHVDMALLNDSAPTEL